MSRNVLIPFSGGMDSTYLIIDRLLRGDTVYAHWYYMKSNQAQMQMESRARKDIAKYFEEKYPEQFIWESDPITEILDSTHLRLTQPPIWIYGVVHSLQRLNRQEIDIDQVELSYVLNDDAISWLHDIADLYKAYAPFLDFELPPIQFPIIKFPKNYIYEQLPAELRKCIVACEAPVLIKDAKEDDVQWKHCESCHSCRRMHRDLGLDQRETIDEYTKRIPGWLDSLTLDDLTKEDLSHVSYTLNKNPQTTPISVKGEYNEQQLFL